MSIRSNSGFINIDRRFGTSTQDVTGSLSREQHYLERLNDRLSLELIPEPTVWYDADISNITFSGTDITSWADKSNNGIDANNSTGADRPVHNLIDPDHNSLSSVDFGTDDFLQTSTNSLLNCNGTGGMTVYIVFDYDSSPSTFSFLAGHTNGTSWTQGWGIFTYSGNMRFFINNWNTSTQYVSLPIVSSIGGAHIFKMHYDQVNITAETFGTTANSATRAYTGAITDATAYGLELGRGGSSSYDINGAMGEFIFYNRPLSADEQIKVEIYLSNKYNISL